MISLGADTAANVYKHLTEEEIERMSSKFLRSRKWTVQRRNLSLICSTAGYTTDYISQGGIAYAKSILEKALGVDEAAAIMNRLTSTLQVRPFDFAKADPTQILNFIQNEHPQTIALVFFLSGS